MIHRSFEIPFDKRKKNMLSWLAPYPNPADFNFNYRKLMDSVKDKAISYTDERKKIAVIGMGIAGLTTARELLRCGYDVSLFEATGIYGGRHDTHTITSDTTQFSVMEGGAMRMPPFLVKDSDPKNGNSILSYYMKDFNIDSQPFPNPGSAVTKTGIFYNDGYESGLTSQQMLIWEKADMQPPSEALKIVYKKWHDFINQIVSVVSKAYIDSSSQYAWQGFWKNIVSNYWNKTFRDVILEPIKSYNPKDRGNFGGVGMNEEEAKLFYIIGAGDGSWGSFYNFSFLYVYRTFVHGFSSDLRLLKGPFIDNIFMPGPEYNDKNLTDTRGVKIDSPKYVGVKSLDDFLLFSPVNIKGDKTQNYSLYSASKDAKAFISIKEPIQYINKEQDGTLTVGVSDREYLNFEAVVITTPTWNINTGVGIGFSMNNFDTKTQWSYDLQTYLSRAHWEPCCKIFVTLTEAYWENPDCKIPQAIATDTFLQDVYGVQVETNYKEQKSVLLLSYTWWRDATKLVSYSDDELVSFAISELDKILLKSKNINQKISDYIDLEAEKYVIHWEKKPYNKGAARLYDENTWEDTQLPMEYNQVYSKASGIYFAGEAFGVDAGWTEPAYRTAIDTVLYISKNLGATFQVPNFDFDTDYLKYDINWRPKKPSN